MYLSILMLMVPFVICQDKQLIDKYVKEINDFIESSEEYVRPNNSYKYADGADDPEMSFGGIFDFIIVGAGSSGTVIANRLSEIKNWKILLLESGELETEVTDIPAMVAYLRSGKYTWPYQTTPQKNICQNRENQVCNYPRGNVLGGTSVINSMVYSRGNKEDYDRWAAQGNPGWSYKELQPFFLKSEDSDLPEVDSRYHNKGGELHVEYVRYRPTLAKIFLEANKELGREFVDYNGEQQLGVSWIQLSTINGSRCSGAKAFIKPVQRRRNLSVRTKALALKIEFQPHTNKILGVRYIQNKKYYVAKVTKEVILSAGPVNSPQLLLLSGIGPKDHLNSLGIKVRKNLPVGQNLLEHVIVNGLEFNTSLMSENITMREAVREYLQGYGPATSPGPVAISFIKTKSWKENYPNIEFTFSPNGNVMALEIIVLHPKSKGSVTLKSRSPFAYPNIDLNFYGNSENTNYIIEAIEGALQLGNTNALKRYNSTPLLSGGNCTQEPFSREFLKCVLPFIIAPGFHTMNTCRMGPAGDPESVVNNEFRVHGFHGLRVADTGVIPVTISGHTNAIAYAIGEKASHSIISEYRGRSQ